MKTRRYLSANQVRELPLGTRVTLHLHDAHGYPTVLPCEVVGTKGGRGKQLRFDGWDGFGYRAIKNGQKYSVEED